MVLMVHGQVSAVLRGEVGSSSPLQAGAPYMTYGLAAAGTYILVDSVDRP